MRGYGVRGKRGDFEPPISEDLFYRVQAVLSGGLPGATLQQRALPTPRVRPPRILRTPAHRQQGYEILERFHEEGESAKTTDRSQLQKLLMFCRLNKGRVHFVVVFNLTRFARDFRAPRHSSGHTPTSRYAPSCAASPVRVPPLL